MSVFSKIGKVLRDINPDYEKMAVECLDDEVIVSDVLNYDNLLAGYAISKSKLVIYSPKSNLKLDLKDIKEVKLKFGHYKIDMGNYHYDIKPAPLTSDIEKYKLLIKALNER